MVADTYSSVTGAVNWIASWTCDRTAVGWDRQCPSFHTQMRGDLKTFEAGKHRGGLNEFDMFIKDLRQVVTRCSNNTFTRFSMTVDVVFLECGLTTRTTVRLETVLTTSSISSARTTGIRIVAQSWADNRERCSSDTHMRPTIRPLHGVCRDVAP